MRVYIKSPKVAWPIFHSGEKQTNKCFMPYASYSHRGSVAGPLFSESLVSFPDCRDGLRTRQLGQVSHASSPFLVIIVLLLADQETVDKCLESSEFFSYDVSCIAAFLSQQVVFIAARCLAVVDPHARLIFYLQWPDHF